MADLLEKASAWLGRMRVRHASRTVIYQRGEEVVAVAASVGRTVFAVDDGSGAAVSWESRDFLIEAADLVLDGQPVLPQRGDRIRETQGSHVFVYEVMAPGNEPVWRYSDPYRRTLRIHSKHVAVEQP